MTDPRPQMTPVRPPDHPGAVLLPRRRPQRPRRHRRDRPGARDAEASYQPVLYIPLDDVDGASYGTAVITATARTRARLLITTSPAGTGTT